jgi:hypothetical protein
LGKLRNTGKIQEIAEKPGWSLLKVGWEMLKRLFGSVF